MGQSIHWVAMLANCIIGDFGILMAFLYCFTIYYVNKLIYLPVGSIRAAAASFVIHGLMIWRHIYIGQIWVYKNTAHLRSIKIQTLLLKAGYMTP